MKTYTITFVALTCMLVVPGQAQQSPAVPQSPGTAPCTNPAPTPARKQGWLEQKARALACQKNQQFCNLPSTAQETTGTPAAKPCPPAPAPKSQPAAQAQVVQKEAPKTPAYACPPHTALIPGTAYCLAADHSTVDAIVLPPNLAAPAANPNQTKPQQ